jgi:RNA polymerase primary sigma factor
VNVDRPRPTDVPLLSAAEEVALARRIERGDLEAKERMIESNLRLVFAIARTYRGSGVPIADLVQEGTIGLVRAVERFDHRRGLKFSTYAVWWIRRSMLDAIASSNLIRVPARATQQLVAIRRAEADLERTGRRGASDSEIAERTQLSVTTVRSLRDSARVTASLDEPISEDTGTLGDLVADERAADPSDTVIANESRHEVSAMLRLLPDRYREVLVRRYGLDGRSSQSHAEIGAWLGVGEERSRQIERDGLHRMRSIAARSAKPLAQRGVSLAPYRTAA